MANPRVRSAASIDDMVWPSLFASQDGVAIPVEAMGMQGLTNDLHWTIGQSAAVSRKTGVRSPWLIAASVPVEDFELIHEVWPSDLTNPRSPDREWKMLGYDVTDRWLLSVLMNCGFDAAKFPGVDLLASLNRFHLFQTAEAAAEFRRRLRGTVQAQHEPSLIVAMWAGTPQPPVV